MTDAFNIFDELSKWARTLDTWQQCALTKLVGQSDLSESDYQQIFSEFMIEKSLWPKREGKNSYPLNVPTTIEDKQGLVKLRAIRDIKGVNALAPGQDLNIGDNLTVFYGPNASGKSGFARILKAACFTRSPSLEILGNIHVAAQKRERPTATFVLADDTVVLFEVGKPCAPLRDNFAVFDNSCIRVHTDEKNSFGVTPYLFDVFPKLVSVGDRVGAMLGAEIGKAQPNIQSYRIDGGTSKVAVALNGLSHETNLGEMESLAVFSEVEESRAAEIDKKLAEIKAANQAEVLKTLSRKISDVNALDEKFLTLVKVFSSDALDPTKKLMEEIKELTDLAAATSAAQFNGEPVQPVGSQTWLALLKAAIAFNEEAYPDKGFPLQTADALCVLCQQPLADDARVRLTRFYAFVTSDTEVKLVAATRKLLAMRQQFENLDLAFFGQDSAQRRTIEEMDAQLVTRIEQFLVSLQAARDSVRSNFDKKAWTDVPAVTNSISSDLEALRAKLESAADELKKQDTAAVVRQLSAELSLLRDRMVLAEVFSEVKKTVEALKWSHRAERVRAIPHRHITEKQKALVKDLLGKGFETEFHANCIALHLDVPLQFKITGAEGTTNRQLGFQAIASPPPSRVLSEGEQTAVALADFLTEVRLNKSSIGIIFDDPVTSMDHMRKEVIAKRLVEEAKIRQVLIFTHDIVFTQYLTNAAIEANVNFMGRTISRAGDGAPGWVDLDAFPHPHYEKEAIGVAHQCLQDARNATGDNREICLRRGCASLRTAYEHFVQSRLFQDVIGRWRENIKYIISDVYVDPDIAKRIDQRMAFLSKYIEGHSHSVQSQEVPLTPELLEVEIKALAKIKDDYNAARKTWEKSKTKTGDVLS